MYTKLPKKCSRNVSSSNARIPDGLEACRALPSLGLCSLTITRGHLESSLYHLNTTSAGLWLPLKLLLLLLYHTHRILFQLNITTKLISSGIKFETPKISKKITVKL